MSIVVGTGKNARVRLNTGELQNRKEAEKKTETPAKGTDIAKGKGGKSGGKGKGKEEAPKTETPADGTNVAKGKEETSKADTPVEGAGGNENQTEE